jgi:cell division protein FtsB
MDINSAICLASRIGAELEVVTVEFGTLQGKFQQLVTENKELKDKVEKLSDGLKLATEDLVEVTKNLNVANATFVGVNKGRADEKEILEIAMENLTEVNKNLDAGNAKLKAENAKLKVELKKLTDAMILVLETKNENQD